MALDASFAPWQAALDAKERNRQQLLQNIGGLGEGFNTIGQAVQEQRKKALLNQIVQAMQQKGQPIPGPQGYTPPNQMKGSTAVPSGAPIDNSNLIQSLMTQYDPQTAIAEQLKQSSGSPWAVVPNMLVGGKPVQENKKTGLLRPGAFEVTPTGKGNASFGSGAITWDTASPQDQDLAKALYEGNIRPYDLGFRDRTVGVKLANEYANKNGLPPFQSYSGDVHAGTSKAFAFGKPGMNVLSLNTALGHTKSAMDAYDAVGNTDVRFLNTPLNKLKEQTNDPNIIKLQTALNALQGELATTFKGSAGTDQEIGHWMNVLSRDLTPKQAIGAIQEIGDLLNSRLDALQTMRSTGMGRPGGSPLLSPHAKTVSEMIKGKGEKKTSFNSVQEAEAAGLPPGTKVTINGRSATIQ